MFALTHSAAWDVSMVELFGLPHAAPDTAVSSVTPKVAQPHAEHVKGNRPVDLKNPAILSSCKLTQFDTHGAPTSLYSEQSTVSSGMEGLGVDIRTADHIQHIQIIQPSSHSYSAYSDHPIATKHHPTSRRSSGEAVVRPNDDESDMLGLKYGSRLFSHPYSASISFRPFNFDRRRHHWRYVGLTTAEGRAWEHDENVS